MRESTHLDRTLLAASGWDLVDRSFFSFFTVWEHWAQRLAPALGHRGPSMMVSSFSLFERNKTPASFMHQYLIIKYIKLSSALL